MGLREADPDEWAVYADYWWTRYGDAHEYNWDNLGDGHGNGFDEYEVYD